MSLVSYWENEIPPMTPEREAELRALDEKIVRGDVEVDCSDIPELTREELAEFRPWNEVMAERKAGKQTVTA